MKLLRRLYRWLRSFDFAKPRPGIWEEEMPPGDVRRFKVVTANRGENPVIVLNQLPSLALWSSLDGKVLAYYEIITRWRGYTWIVDVHYLDPAELISES